MIDLFERQALADILIRLSHKKSNWDELDAFLVKNPTSFQDNAILEIGYTFLGFFDPEWPCNLMNLKSGLIFRTLLFLYSTQEYLEPKDIRGLWVKFFDFFYSFSPLFLGVLSGLVISFFISFSYGLFFWVFYGLFFGFFRDMSLNRFRSYKIDLSPPNEEDQDFWPFALREAYQEEKKLNGGRIQALMQDGRVPGADRGRPLRKSEPHVQGDEAGRPEP